MLDLQNCSCFIYSYELYFYAKLNYYLKDF